MSKMRAVEVTGPNKAFRLIERDIPTPKDDEVLIKVEACGVCHSDSFTKEGSFPGIEYPRIPGHEVVGKIIELGSKVQDFKKGQKVGVGWFGGNCGFCSSCRRGDFITCKRLEITGVTRDGGYAEYMVAKANALALIPEELDTAEAAPLLCAGITTFNALRNSGAKPGDVVAVLGLGGLGHLAVQFAVKMGFKTIAIARGKDKEELAKNLGAFAYIDSEKNNPSEILNQYKGANVVISTITNSKAVEAVLDGLALNGKLVLVGASSDPLPISPLKFIMNVLSVRGWASGTAVDSEDTMNFCALTGVKSMNQYFPLEKYQEAYDLMMSGKARFRAILTMSKE